MQGTIFTIRSTIRAVVAWLVVVTAPSALSDAAVPGVMSYLESSRGELYTLSLPGGRTPESPAPLVVSLHYGGPVSPHYGSGLLESLVEPALRTLGAVMLAPDCGAASWRDCEATVVNLMNEVAAQHSIDPARILLTGYSKGGIGTWDLAGRLPERFSAAIVMAARPPGELASSDWRTPARVLHGRADELFPVAATEASVTALRAAGASVELEILDGVSHYDVAQFAEPLSRAAQWLEQLWAH